MPLSLTFSEAARLPEPGDNVAIATRRLEAGTLIAHEGRTLRLSHTIMEGHRLVVNPIAKGEALLSWGLPFGHALRNLIPGEYICNAKILNTLRNRNIDFALPEQENFTDFMQTYQMNPATFRPGRQLEPAKEKDTFRGYLRPGRRGVGTRNFVVLLGTSSLSASFCRTLEAQAQEWRRAFPNVDGVVAVTHTEGGTPHSPNNRDLLLRSLAGFLVHANVGAVIAVERGGEVISNAVLREFMEANHYPLGDVPHEFFNLGAGFQEELKRGGESVRRLLTQANATARTPQPASTLKIALQCGGSDAFSGISGNPLAGDVARRVILQGGAANLAETDELIGAEPYVLSNVRDAQTAQTFLKMVERFKERAAWHGHSAEGNPSGGNQYRGLYNIALKSIGAARKKPPEVRLDHVIEYSQPMAEGGYYFMDSPGNDLESIAGQVGSGCNMILFTTGNGSITNFPFVPTLKIVTTTGRWQMLAKEMDVNAGRYNDGLSMDALGEETYRLTLDVASGKLSLGESAGHSQVSIWRDWAQTDGSHLQALQNHPAPAGKSLTLPPSPAPAKDSTFHALRSKRGVATRQLGLVVPTSICSAQVARVLADRLNANIGKYTGVDRFVALVHTEGCGAAPGYSTELFLRTVHGHIVHPAVRRALLLEHGCEQTHNDAMRQYLSKQGVPLGDLGWASVQLDGGMETVMAKAERWFAEHLNDAGPESVNAGLESLRLGLTATGVLEDAPARALALLGRQIVAAGGLVVLPQNAALIKSRAFLSALLGQADEPAPTLGYGEAASGSGLHVMETPTSHGVETFTGLAATGVEVMLAHVAGAPLQTHPMVPLLQVSAHAATARRFAKDLDETLDPSRNETALADQLRAKVLEVASRRYTPRLFGQGNSDFQLTRGWLGLSL